MKALNLKKIFKMKKLFSYLIPLVVLISSCRKDDSVKPAEEPKLPQGVSTTTISQITQNSAISGGSIVSDGGAAITARGIVWSTITNPTINLNTKTTNADGIGQFSSALTNLVPGTVYYVRAYATNNVGTEYGDQKTFTTTGTTPTQNVHVAGQLQGNPNKAIYWKDGNIFPLSDGSRHAFAKAVFADETGVFVAGEEHNTSGIYVAKYWWNGQAINLSNGIKHAFANGIAVSKSLANIYVCGSQETSGQRQAKYWKNGTEHNLTDGAKHAVATSVFVTGNSSDEVYITGYMNDPLEIARYWKNGNEILLAPSSGMVRSVANSIAVSGSDIYVAGYQQYNVANGGKYIATIWKNGTATLLGSPANNSYATGVAVKGSNVFVAVYENVSGINVARVWKNNSIFTTLSNGNIDEHTSSIFVTNQEDVYVAGYSGNVNTGIQAKYWKNGVGNTISGGTYAWGIFVY